jgi:hypothetical protein
MLTPKYALLILASALPHSLTPSLTHSLTLSSVQTFLQLTDDVLDLLEWYADPKKRKRSSAVEKSAFLRKQYQVGLWCINTQAEMLSTGIMAASCGLRTLRMLYARTRV